jgi:hypothetical protein
VAKGYGKGHAGDVVGRVVTRLTPARASSAGGAQRAPRSDRLPRRPRASQDAATIDGCYDDEVDARVDRPMSGPAPATPGS